MNATLELGNGDEFQDPLLDVVQTVVVLIQDYRCPVYVQVLVAGDAPWQGGEPIEVVPGHVEFGRVVV